MAQELAAQKQQEQQFKQVYSESSQLVSRDTRAPTNILELAQQTSNLQRQTFGPQQYQSQIGATVQQLNPNIIQKDQQSQVPQVVREQQAKVVPPRQYAQISEAQVNKNILFQYSDALRLKGETTLQPQISNKTGNVEIIDPNAILRGASFVGADILQGLGNTLEGLEQTRIRAQTPSGALNVVGETVTFPLKVLSDKPTQQALITQAKEKPVVLATEIGVGLATERILNVGINKLAKDVVPEIKVSRIQEFSEITGESASASIRLKPEQVLVSEKPQATVRTQIIDVLESGPVKQVNIRSENLLKTGDVQTVVVEVKGVPKTAKSAGTIKTTGDIQETVLSSPSISSNLLEKSSDFVNTKISYLEKTDEFGAISDIADTKVQTRQYTIKEPTFTASKDKGFIDVQTGTPLAKVLEQNLPSPAVLQAQKGVPTIGDIKFIESEFVQVRQGEIISSGILKSDPNVKVQVSEALVPGVQQFEVIDLAGRRKAFGEILDANPVIKLTKDDQTLSISQQELSLGRVDFSGKSIFDELGAKTDIVPKQKDFVGPLVEQVRPGTKKSMKPFAKQMQEEFKINNEKAQQSFSEQFEFVFEEQPQQKKKQIESSDFAIGQQVLQSDVSVSEIPSLNAKATPILRDDFVGAVLPSASFKSKIKAINGVSFATIQQPKVSVANSARISAAQKPLLNNKQLVGSIGDLTRTQVQEQTQVSTTQNQQFLGKTNNKTQTDLQLGLKQISETITQTELQQENQLKKQTTVSFISGPKIPRIKEPEIKIKPKRKREDDDFSITNRFRTKVKRGGRFIDLGKTFETGAQAFEAGYAAVRGSAARSFQVIGTGTIGQIRQPQDIYKSQKQPNVFVQASKTAISSAGEKQEITARGILATKLRKVRGFFK